MSRRAVALLLAAAACAAAADKPRVSRAEISAVEKAVNETIQHLDVDSPYDLLGMTRGIYLEGYGAVFTAEVNLIIGPLLLNFRPPLTKPEIEKLRQRKLGRLPLLRQKMQELLLRAAPALPGVPPDEQIVLGVTFYYQPWENKEELPGQLVVQASRQALLDSVAKRTAAVIRMEEF